MLPARTRLGAHARTGRPAGRPDESLRVGQLSFDGLETINFRGEAGMNQMVESVYRQWDHYVTCGASLLTHFQWHLYDSLGWGEVCVNLRDDVELRSRLAMSIGVHERNLMPKGLGSWPLRRSTPFWEATNSDDMEYLLAKCAGYDANFALEICWEDLQLPMAGRFFDLIKRWETLRLARAFTPQQRDLLRTPGMDFRLEVSDPRPRVKAVKADRPSFRCLDRERPFDPVILHNPYRRQPVRFTLRVLPAFDPGHRENIPLLPSSAQAMIPGSDPGTLAVESIPASPAEARLNPAAVSAYRIACVGSEPPIRRPDPSAGGCAPMRLHWATGADILRSALEGDAVMVQRGRTSGRGGVLNLLQHRGLGMWLDVEIQCPGAWLAIELLDHARRIRQYYAPLDAPGRRWVEWPNGEMDLAFGRWYRYRTDAMNQGSDCSWFQANKWFDYGNIAEIRLMIVNVSPGMQARVVISSLCALREIEVPLTSVTLAIGNQRLRFQGNVPVHHYLVYESGKTAGVFDANWTALGKVPAEGTLNAPGGGSSLVIADESGGERFPWIAFHPRLLGRSFRVKPAGSS